jgi:RHS repeat-associated protein
LTGLNSITPTYDANGNTLSDGTNSYTWDERNRMRTVTGPVDASFQYDAIGRRVQKTIGSTTTSFLYDGINHVQEQSAAGAWVATELTGGTDEVLARMTSAGIVTPIGDAQGSTIAETNAAQTVTTSFAYEPYGKTSQTGTVSTNSQQYTGRENDGTGLYFYRARYYNPGTGRFISEDPIGFLGGPNTRRIPKGRCRHQTGAPIGGPRMTRALTAGIPEVRRIVLRMIAGPCLRAQQTTYDTAAFPAPGRVQEACSCMN